MSLSSMKRELRAYKRRISSEKTNVNESKNPFHEILLTGSTGYFGVHFLHALLAATDSRIHLLVRAESDSEAVLKQPRFGDFISIRRFRLKGTECGCTPETLRRNV